MKITLHSRLSTEWVNSAIKLLPIVKILLKTSTFDNMLNHNSSDCIESAAMVTRCFLKPASDTISDVVMYKRTLGPYSRTS